ncbi:DMT family transporter [Celerinatantimonas yamalensis]|uniref:DMT family transporter n=1 Tax=Celerinatantimonas yamalensis TaxID=559956 RepID=A0ABW9G6U3_9GAMM
MAGIVFIMIACLTWALDTLIRYPLLGQGFSTLQIVLFEHLTLVLVTSPLLWRYRHHFMQMNSTQSAALFFIGGVGSALGTLAFTQAFHYLNPTIVILLQKLQPLVAILLASWWLKERIHGYFIRWAGLILLGSLVMIWPDVRHLAQANWYYANSTPDIIKGYSYTLLAVLAWGVATVCGKYLASEKMPANAIMSGRFATGLMVLLPLALLYPASVQPMATLSLGKLVMMALLSGLLGMWLYYQGLKRIPAQLATLAEQTFPVFAAIINWLFLGMSLSSYQIAGALLLVLGNIGLRFKEMHLPVQPGTASLNQA